MNNEKETTIPLDKNKIALRCTLQGALIVLCGFIIKITLGYPSSNTILIVIASVVVLFFAASSFAFTFSKLFSKSPGFVISASGIVDNTAGPSAGAISWEEIAKIYLTIRNSRFSTIRFVTIEVNDPQKYLMNGNFLARIFKKINYTFFKSPIHISNVSLKISFNELASMVEQYYKQYGHTEHQAQM
jgi:hypothetical protein